MKDLTKIMDEQIKRLKEIKVSLNTDDVLKNQKINQN